VRKYKRPTSRLRNNIKFSVEADKDDDTIASSLTRQSVLELQLPESDTSDLKLRGMDGFVWNRRKDEAALIARDKAHRHFLILILSVLPTTIINYSTGGYVPQTAKTPALSAAFLPR